MVDVDFEEQGWQPSSRFEEQGGSGSKITNLILKTGLVKDPKKANYVLIAVSILFFSMAIYFFIVGISG